MFLIQIGVFELLLAKKTNILASWASQVIWGFDYNFTNYNFRKNKHLVWFKLISCQRGEIQWCVWNSPLRFSEIIVGEIVHPIPIIRFRLFRTQPLENLSAAVKLPQKKSFWATQPLAKILWGKILWWELGVVTSPYDQSRVHEPLARFVRKQAIFDRWYLTDDMCCNNNK